MYTHTEIATTSVKPKKNANNKQHRTKQANKLSERAKEVSPAGRAKSTKESDKREQEHTTCENETVKMMMKMMVKCENQ